MTEVRLEWFEVLMGATTGMHRRIQSMKLHPRSERDYTNDRWGRDIESALAEVAVGKSLKMYWPGSIDVGSDPDVGKLQVRHTELSNGHLIVRPRDSDLHTFVLVTGRMGIYQVHGWITGEEAKRIGDVRDPAGREPAHWINSGQLHPLNTLLKRDRE